MNQAKIKEQLRAVDKALEFVVGKMTKGEIDKTSNFDRITSVMDGSDFEMIAIRDLGTPAEKFNRELQVKGNVLNSIRQEFETDKVFSTAMAYIAVRTALDTLGSSLGKEVSIKPFAQTKEQNVLSDIYGSKAKVMELEGMGR